MLMSVSAKLHGVTPKNIPHRREGLKLAHCSTPGQEIPLFEAGSFTTIITKALNWTLLFINLFPL
jgi:hypothetical protein